MRKWLLFFLIIFLIIGCGGSGSSNNFKDYTNNIKFSNVKINDNGKLIFITLDSLVGPDNYIVGTYSKNYDSIITVASPYNITYTNCILEKNESDYLLYSCSSYQNICNDEDIYYNDNCVQVYTDKDKDMYIDKKNATYLYEQDAYGDEKYIIGEFDYNGTLTFKQYDTIEVVK